MSAFISYLYLSVFSFILLLQFTQGNVVSISSEKTIYSVSETIVINCTTSTPSALNVQWYFNQEYLDSNQVISITADISQISITNVTFDDAGNYSCGLLGDVPSDWQTIELHVGVAPTHVANFTCYTFNIDDIFCSWDEGSKTNIPTSYTFYYTAYYRNDYVPDHKSYNWTECPDSEKFPDCPDEIHDYTYSCYLLFEYDHLGSRHNVSVVARNDLGTVTSALEFNPDLEVTPFPPRNLNAIPEEPGCLKITWNLPCDWIGSGYNLQYAITYQSQWDLEWSQAHIIQRSTSYLLCNLESFTEYTIKVKASETFLDLDSEYWSDWSSSTTAITAEGAPLTQLHLDHDIKRNPEFENKMDVILTWDPLSVRDMRGVVLGYNVTVVEATQQLLKNTALTNATTYRVIGLDIYSTYEIHVVTYNSVGSSPDASVTVSFPASAPSPPTLVTAKALSASNIHIRWNPSPSMNTDITSYTIYWSSSDSHTRHYNFTNVDGDLEYTVTNLLAYTRYEFYITASNVVGEGGQSLPVYEYTLEAVPTSSPRDVEMNTIEENPTRLSVRWRSPCLSNQNGIILGYLVYYCPLLNTSQCDGVEVINVTATDLENRVLTQWYLDNLKPYTYYKVIIAAYNSIGIGPNSTEVYNRTSQGAPSKPIRPVVTDITAVNMTVHWEPPIIPNGNIIKYEVKYNEDKVTTYTTSVVLEDLSGYTEYDIQIQACSEAVINPCGDFASLNKRTDIGVPGQMSAPVAKVTDVNTVNITFAPPSQPNGPLEFMVYQIYKKADADNSEWEKITSLDNGETQLVVSEDCHDDAINYFYAVDAVSNNDGVELIGKISGPSAVCNLCYSGLDVGGTIGVTLGVAVSIIIIICLCWYSRNKYKKSEISKPIPKVNLDENWMHAGPNGHIDENEVYEVYDLPKGGMKDFTQDDSSMDHVNGRSRFARQSSGGYSDASQNSDSRLINSCDDEVFTVKTQDYHPPKNKDLKQKVDMPNKVTHQYIPIINSPGAWELSPSHSRFPAFDARVAEEGMYDSGMGQSTQLNYSQMSPDGVLVPVTFFGQTSPPFSADSGIDYQWMSPSGQLSPLPCDYSKLAPDRTTSPSIQKKLISRPENFSEIMNGQVPDVTVMSVHGVTLFNPLVGFKQSGKTPLQMETASQTSLKESTEQELSEITPYCEVSALNQQAAVNVSPGYVTHNSPGNSCMATDCFNSDYCKLSSIDVGDMHEGLPKLEDQGYVPNDSLNVSNHQTQPVVSASYVAHNDMPDAGLPTQSVVSASHVAHNDMPDAGLPTQSVVSVSHVAHNDMPDAGLPTQPVVLMGYVTHDNMANPKDP